MTTRHEIILILKFKDFNNTLEILTDGKGRSSERESFTVLGWIVAGNVDQHTEHPSLAAAVH